MNPSRKPLAIMSKEGGCFCGNVRIKYSGEPQGKALCHCMDCRKITGSTYSTNLIIPGEGFEVTKGTPKTIAKKADSGNTITSHFCGDCGSTLWCVYPGKRCAFPSLLLLTCLIGVMERRSDQLKW